MRDNVFWRKVASVISMLAKELGIPPEEAICVFYASETARLLADPATGLRLMSDGYLLEDLLRETKPDGPVSRPASSPRD